jgi:PIN domain nuclease of toxin-antitoxin system
VKLLLDTHVWLWSLLDPSRLREQAAAALADTTNEKWLSPISVWEALLLTERGKLALSTDGETWVRKQLAATPVRQAPFDHEVVIVSRVIKLPHQDPADRFIAATARVHDMTLVTGDGRLLAKPDGFAVLAATA